MAQYAKYISENKVEFFKTPDHISLPENPAQEVLDMLKAMAEELGYKKYNPSTPPNGFYKQYYRETDKNVYQEWSPIDLEEAKIRQKALVKQSCDNARAEAFAIYSQAEQVAAQEGSDTTIAVMAQVRGVTPEKQQADIELAMQMGTVINAALAGYFLRLEDAIKTAEDVDTVASISWSREDFTEVVESLLGMNQQSSEETSTELP